MSRRKRAATAVFLGVLILLCALGLVIPSSKTGLQEWWWLNRHSDHPFLAAISFVTAMRLNHQAAYEMSSPDLWPRIDEWMESHEPQECSRLPDEIFGGAVGPRKSTVMFDCTTKTGDIYTLWMEDVEVNASGLVLDWGDVTEGMGKYGLFSQDVD